VGGGCARTPKASEAGRQHLAPDFGRLSSPFQEESRASEKMTASLDQGVLDVAAGGTAEGGPAVPPQAASTGRPWRRAGLRRKQ